MFYFYFRRPRTAACVEDEPDYDEGEAGLQDLVVALHVLEEDLERGLQGAIRTVIVHVVLQHISVNDVVVHHCRRIHHDQSDVQTDFGKVT